MVYVDALQQVRTTGTWKYREACHLLADTLDELHAFAAQIQLKRAWYQPRSAPHYDLTRAKRAAAVKAGAVELDARQVRDLLRKLRHLDSLTDTCGYCSYNEANGDLLLRCNPCADRHRQRIAA